MAKKPQICLGTVQWGMDYGISNHNGIPTDLELTKILEIARNNDIKKLDTARSYGLAESRIGKFNEKYKKQFQVTTKVDLSSQTMKLSKSAISEEIYTSIQKSMDELRVTKLESVLLHRGNLAIEKDMIAWTTLREIQLKGLIDNIGFSALNPSEADLAFELPGCQVVQVATSLLDQRISRVGFFQKCREIGIETYARSIFLQGTAFLKPDQLRGKLKELNIPLVAIEKHARELGLSGHELWKIFAKNLEADYLVVGFTNHSELNSFLAPVRKDPTEIDLTNFSKQFENFSNPLLDPALWGNLESDRLFTKSTSS